MNEQQAQCYHQGFNSMYDDEGFPKFKYDTHCPDCGKTQGDIYLDVNDIDPTTKLSQQPHGKSTYHCNKCDGYTEPIMFKDKECCSRHQRTYSDGTKLYDEYEED
jgi:hypothetical protein